MLLSTTITTLTSFHLVPSSTHSSCAPPPPQFLHRPLLSVSLQPFYHLLPTKMHLLSGFTSVILSTPPPARSYLKLPIPYISIADKQEPGGPLPEDLRVAPGRLNPAAPVTMFTFPANDWARPSRPSGVTTTRGRPPRPHLTHLFTSVAQ